jgi:FHA domain
MSEPPPKNPPVSTSAKNEQVAALSALENTEIPALTARVAYVTGWLVAIAGPGKGSAVPTFEGMNSVGRDPAQRIPLNFGDEGISREDHFFVTYEPKRRMFHISPGTKDNLVYLNSEVVLGPKPLADGGVIEVGNTKLRFVALCGSEFNWDDA